MDPVDTAVATPGAAPARAFEPVEFAPFILLIACLVARWAGVPQGEVEPIELVCCLLIDPRRMGGRA